MKTPILHRVNGGSGLLAKLLIRGDEISIVQGRLLIRPSSGLEVPPSWLKQNESLLINDICKLFNINVLRYQSYSTGCYGFKKSEGITLQFNNLKTNEGAYVVFNASLKRTRNSNGNKKGERLPNKQFNASKRTHFYKFWCSTGLKLPKSPSKFYECMGKLKALIFTGEIDIKNRITNKIIPLLEINYQEILAKSSLSINHKNCSNVMAKEPLILRQETAKEPLNFAAKKINTELNSTALERNQSACTSQCGNKVIRKEVISSGVSYDNRLTKTTNNKKVVDSNIIEISGNYEPEIINTNKWLTEWENSFTEAELQEVMTNFN